MPAALYVETRIHATMDRLWDHTQGAGRHQRWDLRFGEIRALPGAPDEPQRFRYSTRVLPGLTIGGTGTHAGERRRPDGGCTSALRFESGHPLSLIREGSGFWRYVPDGDGVRFLTGYDYRPGWGRAGVVADRVFRPALGWATAWSFDRLRIWLELGVPPEVTRRRALTDLAARAFAVLAASVLPALLTDSGAAARLGLALTVAAGAVLLPPSRTTPAARRCRRTPPTPVRAPRIAETLQEK